MSEASFTVEVDFRNESVTYRTPEGWTFAGLYAATSGRPTVLSVAFTRRWYPAHEPYARSGAGSPTAPEHRLRIVEAMLREIANGMRPLRVDLTPGAAEDRDPDPQETEIAELAARLNQKLGAQIEVVPLPG